MEKSKEELVEALEINENERYAIEAYKGPQHAPMNVLLNYTSKTYEKMNRGWNLPKDAEFLDHLITNFSNLYSAMCKEVIKKGPKYYDNYGFRNKLYRGTSTKDIESEIKPYMANRFLSTTFDEDIAKQFAEYNNAAIMEIQADRDVPFLIVSDYDDEDREDEVIFSPFSYIKAEEYDHSSKEYKHYNVRLSKSKLDKVTKTELKKLRKEVLSGIEEHAKRVQEESPLSVQISCLEKRVCDMNLSSGDAIEDYNAIQKDIKSKREELEEISNQSKRYVTKLGKLLQGLCYEKEKEIEKAYKELSKINEKELEIKKAKELQDIKYQIKVGIKSAKELPSLIVKFRDDMALIQAKDNELRKKFGLSFDISNRDSVENRTEIEPKIKEIDSNIQAFLKDVDLNAIENVTVSNLEEKRKELYPIVNNIFDLADVVNRFNQAVKLPEEYSAKLNETLKKDIFNKARKMILDSKKARLEFDMEDILAYDPGFFGKFNGEEELRSLTIENMGLKIKALDNEILDADTICDKFELDETSDDLLICALAYLQDLKTNSPGFYDEDMEDLSNKIIEAFHISDKEVKPEYLKEFLEERQQDFVEEEPINPENLPVKKTKKHHFFFRSKRKLEIEQLRYENEGLKNKILRFNMNNSLNRFIHDEVDDFNEMIDEAIRVSKKINTKEDLVIDNSGKESINEDKDLADEEDAR